MRKPYMLYFFYMSDFFSYVIDFLKTTLNYKNVSLP